MKVDHAQSTTSVSHRPALQKDFLRALVDGFPLAVSVFAYGIAYGALAHTTNHLNLWQTISLSVFVFAGASQFTVLALLHQGVAFAAIVSSTFLLNARQMLYGLTLGPNLLATKRRTLAFLSHGLTDESYSVAMVEAQKRPVSALYFLGAGSAVFVPWQISTVLGFGVGGLIGDPARFGLDFAFIGAFLGLWMAQLKTMRHVLAAAAAVVLSIAAYHWFGTSGAIVTGAAVSFCFGVMEP